MIGRHIKLLVLSCAVAALACLVVTPSCMPGPIAPSTTPGCLGACEQGAALECSWSGEGCVDFCNQYHAVGYMRPWADCVGQAGDVEAVNACGMSCR